MRLIRLLLQWLIGLAGATLVGIALLLPEQPDYRFAATALAFFSVLGLMTLLLREVTEDRLAGGRPMRPRVLAAVMFVLGAAGFGLAWAIATGSVPRGRLLRVAIDVLGPVIPAIAVAIMGAAMLRTGWVLLRR